MTIKKLYEIASSLGMEDKEITYREYSNKYATKNDDPDSPILPYATFEIHYTLGGFFVKGDRIK